MLSIIITFLTGALFAGSISFYLSRMILRAEVIDMINEETSKRIKDLEFELSYTERKLYISNRESTKIIENRNRALTERDEALLMLSKKLSDDNT